MNVVFLSPHFPTNYHLFCVHLRALGANVLGICDQPYEQLHPALQSALTAYYFVPDLHDYDAMVRALGYFTYRYGKIDWIDSLNEHWLEIEAQLRTDFHIEGIMNRDLPQIKRKSEMKRVFTSAGINTAPGQLAQTPQQARAFAKEVGFPIIAKPDIGVGAKQTYKITNAEELEAFLNYGLTGYFMEAYIPGVIQSFDGLVDHQGRLVFYISTQYSQGVMEVVNTDSDVYYYTQRKTPTDLEGMGRTLVEAFQIRKRFFHFEFFRTPDNQLIALEVNMRPPGGLSIDLFNYANDIDLYYEWANVVVNHQFTAECTWPFHACYAGRKHHRAYVSSHDDVLSQYGQHIIHHQPMSEVFRRAMGDYGYIVRSPHLDEVITIATGIQAQSY
ncbi:MAG: carboxylate--amine ligase [Chloroflexota bacterium]